jgi:hypothetical protein
MTKEGLGRGRGGFEEGEKGARLTIIDCRDCCEMTIKGDCKSELVTFFRLHQ